MSKGQLIKATNNSRVIKFEGKILMRVAKRGLKVTVTVWQDETGETASETHAYSTDGDAFRSMLRIAHDHMA